MLRADDADGPYATLVTILRGEELVFVNDDLGVNYTYYYVLEACHAFACGRSDADELLVAPLPPPVVEFPLRIIGASLGADEESVAVTLEWDAVEYTRQYNILRSINGEDGDYVRVGKVRDDLMFVDGVTINFVYHYRLQACNPFGCDVSDKAVEFTMPGKVRIDTVFNQPLTLSAGASRGESVLTVLVRGGTNPRFSSGTNNNFDNTGRRAQTTVSLTRAAAAAFNSDGVTLGFILKAISDDGDASTMTVRFVSTPRAVSANPRTNVLLAADAALGGVVLAGGASGLSIWHNKRDGAAGVETYSLRGGRGSSDDAFFSVNADSGQIAVNVPSLQLGLYDLELLLADEAIGLTATLELRINVIESPGAEAVRIFLAEIASGARQWRGEDEADDWDGDNIANPYDWTPDSVAIIGLDGLIEVNLDMDNADGSSGNPWPIYNVWQLQAIGGMSVSRSGQKSSSNFLFGGSARFRDYRLAADVDATPTREWKDGSSANIVGFDPISGVFGGSFDGEGREIRGLYMKLDDDNGMFHEIGSAGRVLRLGLPDVEISGSGAVRVAPVAHENSGLVSLVWATGEVVANGGFASGLVRQLNSGGQVRESWFVGKVRGSTSTGGLVGYATAGDVRDSWAVARVEWSGTGNRAIGGLVGASEGGFSLFNSWSGGRFDTNVHALIGGAGSFSRSYFDSAISPQSGVNTASALVVDTMVTVTDSTWSTSAWSFGETTDYPFLRRIDNLWPGLQAVVFADFQTENLVVTTLEVEGRSSLEIGESVTLSLGDTNGLAPDGGPTPTRTCANESKYAKLNHNDVTVQLQASGDGSAVFTADCEIVISFADPKTLSLGYFSVSALIASKEATISRWSHSFALNTLFAPLPDTGVVVPADAAKGYAFLTVTLLAGKLERDAAGRTPIFGYTSSPYFDAVFTNTITTSEATVISTLTLTTRAEPRRAMVDATEDNLVAVFSLSDGGATELFARDDEVFYDLRATIGTLTVGIPFNILSVRSAPRPIVGIPSPVTTTITRGLVGATVIAAGQAGLAIWHTFGAEETYSVRAGSNFGVEETFGMVTVTTELSGGNTYTLTMDLTGEGETATREFRFVVDGEQPAERAELVVLNTRRPAANEVVVTLGWRDVARADRYTLSRAAGSDTDGAYRAIYEGGGKPVTQCLTESSCSLWLTYTESDLTIGSVYYYRLDSCNDFGCAEQSEVLSLSVSPPQPRLHDAPPEETPELDVLVAELSPGLFAALVQWDALLTTRVVSGRYTVVLSVSVDSEGVTTTLYREYDADLTLTNALPYEYRLERSLQSDTGYNEVHSVQPYRKLYNMGYGDTNVTLNSVYYYRLQVCNTAGCAAPLSDVLTVTVTPALTKPEVLIARVTPSATAVIAPRIVNGEVTLVPTAVVVGSPTLLWSPVAGATQYRIFRALGDAETLAVSLANGAREYRLLNGEYTVTVATTAGVSVEITDCDKGVVCPANGLKYVDPATLTLETAHYYRVAACNAETCGPLSDAVRVGGPVPPGPTPKGAPEVAIEGYRLDDSDSNLAQADVTWNEVSGANRYRLLRAQIGGGYEVIYEADVSYLFPQSPDGSLPEKIDFIRGQGNSFTDTGLLPGETYLYRAQGCSGTNCGDVSAEAATLRLLRPGRVEMSFADSGSSRAVFSVDAATVVNGKFEKTGAKVWIASSSVTVAWEDARDAEYYYVLRGGANRDDAAVTISYPEVVGSIAVGGVTSFSVTVTLRDEGGYREDGSGGYTFVAPMPTATITQSFTITTQAGTVTTFAQPIPMFGNTFTEILGGDEIRHYWARACNGLGCGELSEAIVLGGGLLGIDEEDNQRAEGVSIALSLIDDSSTSGDVVDLTLTDLVKTPTGVAASACRADVVTRVVDGETIRYGGDPRVNFDWDARSGGEAEGRFYRFARSRFADGASADWIDMTAPATLSRDDNSNLIDNGILTNFAATTFVDNSPFNENDIRSNFAATTLYYGVQECVAVRLGAGFDLDLKYNEDRIVYPHESPICSAPVFVEVAPQSSLPQCAGDGSVSPGPYVNDNLGKVNIRSDLSEVRITLSQTIDDRQLVTVTESGETITYNYLGPQYVIALAAFVVRWDSVLGADYYRVTRESRNLYTGESEITEFGAQGETVYEDIMTASPDVVNIYRVQACDDVEGCGPQSDPLELVAPSPDSPPLFAHIPLAAVVSINFSDPAEYVAAILIADALFANRYVLSRALKPIQVPVDDPDEEGVKLPIYTDLLEFGDDDALGFIDDDVDVGVEYFYRVRACNALGCVDSDHVLISVGPPGPPPVAAAPETTQNVVGQVAQVSVRWDAVANADNYILTRAESASDPFVDIYSGRERAFTDNGVQLDFEYHYQLQACNSFGCTGSEITIEIFPPSQETMDRDFAIAVLSVFYETEIQPGGFNWFGERAGTTSTIDWDGDGIENPYDWTPTSITIDGRPVEVNLTAAFTGAGGTAENPWPIYNVWQLQAIDGVSVSHTGSVSSGLTLFGADSDARLGANYRLATNIDATPTEQWDGGNGFDPIGNIRGGGFGFAPFTGFFDGGGYAVRGLLIDRLAQNIGLFVGIVKRGELAVLNFGVEDANIGSGNSAGILAGSIDANISKVWTTGVVNGFADAGAFAGVFVGTGSGAANTIMMSWSTADVIAVDLANTNANRVGGLVGFNSLRSGAFLDDNWVAGNVSGEGDVGGFAGGSNTSNATRTTFTRNWSAGAVLGGPNLGGFAGADGNTEYTSIYWNEDTSNQTDSAGGGEGAVVQTLIAANFGGNDSTLTWDFGDSVLSDTDAAADFPLLKDLDQPWQAANLARALTRLLGVSDAATLALEAGTTITMITLRLDTNGLAADERADGTSAPSCSFEITGDNRVFRAETNYNGVTVDLRFLADGNGNFLPGRTENCEVGIQVDVADLTATLQLEIFAPATAGYEARSLTTEFALQISLTPTVDPLDAVDDFLAAIEAGDFNWFTNTIDWDNDGITNPYDWTPTLGVNLLAFQSPDGSATDPWPIYNVWQLQAISGISVSDAGVTLGGMTLFGADKATRLRAEYRLATNIDATPTKIWDSNKGFNPIGDSSSGNEFKGFMDGRGYAVRGLFIDRASEDNVGLFGYIDGSIDDDVSDFVLFGQEISRNLGVEDADITGNDRVGIFAGQSYSATHRGIWTTGKVSGADRVGGLIGSYFSDSGVYNPVTVNLSWSTAEVSGDDEVGGLFGENRGEGDPVQLFDNWAGGNVMGDDETGGYSGFTSSSNSGRSWSSGAVVSGNGNVGGFAAPASADSSFRANSSYWNLDTSGVAESNESRGIGAVMQALTDSDFGGEAEAAAWSFGDIDLSDGDGDFPFLKSSSQPWQAVNLARVLARPVGVVAGLEPIAAVAGATLTATRIRLDTNGLAADINSIRTSTPTCAFDPVSRVLQAETNYNNVAIEMTLLADGGEKLIAASDCEVAFEDATNGEFAATLRLIISAPEIGDDETRVLTKDYPLHIDPDPTPDPLAAARAARSEFMAALAAGDFNWFTNTIDWDDDGTANPYDWTPTVGVSLLLDGEDGTAGNPWPIYNVWQLQAIDGVSVSQTGETGTSDIFGDDAATRLGAEYRLATNIDATQTEIWDGKKGFNPIGGDGDNNRFTGFFDGRGYAVRNLLINRPSGLNVGLFARINKAGGLAVTDLGVEDAEVRGEGFGSQFGGVGILAGEAEADFRRVWTTGKVFGSACHCRRRDWLI